MKKFLHKGGVYVGVSAGSVVLSQNLPDNLNYINCTLNVHAEEDTECGYLNTSDCPNIKLTDNQPMLSYRKFLHIMV